jgi:hypothetical protein
MQHAEILQKWFAILRRTQVTIHYFSSFNIIGFHNVFISPSKNTTPPDLFRAQDIEKFSSKPHSFHIKKPYFTSLKPSPGTPVF